MKKRAKILEKQVESKIRQYDEDMFGHTERLETLTRLYSDECQRLLQLQENCSNLKGACRGCCVVWCCPLCVPREL